MWWKIVGSLVNFNHLEHEHTIPHSTIPKLLLLLKRFWSLTGVYSTEWAGKQCFSFFSCCMYVCLPFNRKMFIFWQTFSKKSSLLLGHGQSTTNVDFSKWSELSEGGRVLWNILTEKDIENCISSSSSIIRKKYYLLILLPTYLLMVLVRWSARWISYTIGLLALKIFCRITVFTIYI